MAYQIDFTAANYVSRSRRKTLLRLAAVSAIAGVVWGVQYVHEVYNQPTLDMKLAEYESVVHPIEEMNAAWDAAATEYGTILRYYRLVWAANPTNFLSTMASKDRPRLNRGFRARSWTLKTGGACRLDYVFAFGPGDKAEQADGLEGEVAHAVTSVVAVAGGKVDVQGVKHENLLRLDTLDVTATFSLPDVRAFPQKERALTDCVNEIVSMRRRVQDAKINEKGGVRGGPSTANGIMMAYLQIGRDKPDFPDLGNVINVAGWFSRADRFIDKYRIPGDGADRKKLREIWKKVGEARFPWQRFRALDNDALTESTRVLRSVSDGVKRFKEFLYKRHEDCRKKLEPFVNAYVRNDVFNKPLVEMDLKDRVAKAAGIKHVTVSFKDEAGAPPARLETEEENFTFTWVRWTLSTGGGKERTAGNTAAQTENDVAAEEPVTLAKLADCVRRALRLGPGYVLDGIKIDFGDDGTVAAAEMTGLLPVKTVEVKKGESRK